MIGRDIEHHGGIGAQARHRLQLEAGEFDHIAFNVRRQQIEHRLAEIAADRHPLSGQTRHECDQGRHGALAVGAGDGAQGRLDLAREEFDVADRRHAARDRLPDQRLGERHAGADHEFGGRREHVRVEAADEDRDLGQLRLEHVQTGRPFAAVGHGHTHAARAQMARAGQPRLAQTHDQGLGLRRARAVGGCGRRRHDVHRIFRLARPISTSTTVMIQKRTMTRGSGQPCNSK